VARHHDPFEAYVYTARAWLAQLSDSLDLPPSEAPRALHALRAGLHAIRDRLPAAEVIDLGALLPTIIRGIYYDGWVLHQSPTRIRDRAAWLAHVKQELSPDARLAPNDVLRAVIHLLARHVSPGELDDVVAALPRSIATLWRELATVQEHEEDPTRVPASIGLTRRTGYSR
jgi:uncharacterized protein (DUF2267 family)